MGVGRPEVPEAVHTHLFSLTKPAATTVVAWRGVQDRQTHSEGVIQGGRGGKGHTGCGHLPTSPRAWHPRHSPDAQLTSPVGRIQSHPSKPWLCLLPSPPLPPSMSWGEGSTLGNRP